MSAILPISDAFRSTEIGDFPASWPLRTIGELFDLQQGKALSPAARNGLNPRPFLRTANVFWGRIDRTTVDQMDFTEDERERLTLRSGDLLVCEGGEIGRTALWNLDIADCLFQNHLHRLRARSDEVEPLFVMYWMQAAFLRLGLYRGVGNRTTIPNLSGTRLKQLLLPLPPRPEQKAIASVLSTLQARVEIQDRIVATLKELKAATMAKLFREGLRGEPLKQTEIGEIPENWRLAKLGELFNIQQGKALSEAARRGPSPRPFLRTSNVSWGRLDLTKVDNMHFSPGESARLSLSAGDLLVCECGEIGRTAMWNLKGTEHGFQNHIHRLRRRSDDIHPLFFMYWMETAMTHRRLYLAEGNRTTIPNLSASRLRSFVVPLPQIGDQILVAQAVSSVACRLELAETEGGLVRNTFEGLLQDLVVGRLRVPLQDSKP